VDEPVDDAETTDADGEKPPKKKAKEAKEKVRTTINAVRKEVVSKAAHGGLGEKDSESDQPAHGKKGRTTRFGRFPLFVLTCF
jgi:hypothetical protein